MMATSQGLPSRDLVVRSGEVPESFAHLSTTNIHLSASSSMIGAHGAVGTSAEKEGTEETSGWYYRLTRWLATRARPTGRKVFETFEVKPVPRA
jgi:hypothetical protein